MTPQKMFVWRFFKHGELNGVILASFFQCIIVERESSRKYGQQRPGGGMLQASVAA
jgi:hypothetical protein